MSAAAWDTPDTNSSALDDVAQIGDDADSAVARRLAWLRVKADDVDELSKKRTSDTEASGYLSGS